MLRFITYLVGLSIIVSCTIPQYSFTGGTPTPGAESISIAFFENNTALGPSNLGQTFTETLRDLFQSQTKLELITEDGDLAYEGVISNYVVQPISIQGNQTAAQNRLTITIQVLFQNKIDPSKSFEQGFTRFADFQSSQDLSSVETQLIDDIFDQITQDIYNKTLGDW